MAARKRSGLGSGLANLIPSNQREVRDSPVDVFFADTAHRNAPANPNAGSQSSSAFGIGDSSQVAAQLGETLGTAVVKAIEAHVSTQRKGDAAKGTDKSKKAGGKSAKGSQKKSKAAKSSASKSKDTAAEKLQDDATVSGSVDEPTVADMAVEADRLAEPGAAEKPKEEKQSEAAARSEDTAMDSAPQTVIDDAAGTDGANRTDAENDAADVSRETAHVSTSSDATENASRSDVARGSAEVTSGSNESGNDSETDENEPEGEDLVAVPGVTYGDLPIDLIIPNTRQPRTVFDQDELQELADSIAEVGVLQPIIVRPLEAPLEDNPEARYELIMGERRWRATRLAGLDTVPAIVRRTADEDLLRDALLENLHRAQLNPLEEAAAYQQLLEDFACTQEELSRRIARSRPQISNTLRLLKLPPLVQQRVAAGIISAGHARALLSLPNPVAMEKVAQRIVAENLSVRAVEEIVAMWDEPADQAKPRRKRRVPNPALEDLAVRLGDRFETKVKVTMGARKGSIRIDFAGSEDLERILMVLAPGMSGLDAVAAAHSLASADTELAEGGLGGTELSGDANSREHTGYDLGY